MLFRSRGLPDFPPQLRTLLEHMILSHHGQLEFGSPKLPQFPEALLLHYLDDMDSKMECMRSLAEHDRLVEGCFTSYSTALARPVLKLNRYWNVPEPAAPAVAARTETGPPAATPDPAVAPEPAEADHPLFASKPDSPFADKLRQALQPAASNQEN